MSAKTLNFLADQAWVGTVQKYAQRILTIQRKLYSLSFKFQIGIYKVHRQTASVKNDAIVSICIDTILQKMPK